MHRIDSAGSVSGYFTDGGPSVPAAVVNAAFMNAVQDEIALFIEAKGITLVKGTWTQFQDALKIQQREPPTYTTTGTGSAYILTTTPAITSYVEGQRFNIQAHSNNSAAATINVDTVAAKNIVDDAGNAINAFAMRQYGMYEIVYINESGGYFQVNNSYGWEIEEARGNKTYLGQRLAVAMNDDGIIKDDSCNSLASAWMRFDTGGTNSRLHGISSVVWTPTGVATFTFDNGFYDAQAVVVLTRMNETGNTWSTKINLRGAGSFKIEFRENGTLTDPTVNFDIAFIGQQVTPL